LSQWFRSADPDQNITDPEIRRYVIICSDPDLDLHPDLDPHQRISIFNLSLLDPDPSSFVQIRIWIYIRLRILPSTLKKNKSTFKKQYCRSGSGAFLFQSKSKLEKCK
jgi:hypothetical protein